MRATRSAVTVRSLSVSPYVGLPPNPRSVSSRQPTTVGMPPSQIGITTRNLVQASQAHQAAPAAPPILGPLPQSDWNHIPGSEIQGRYTRRCPAAYALLAVKTARRVVRPDPREPQRPELVVGDVAADPAVCAFDPLLELGQVWIDELMAPGGSLRRQSAGLAKADVAGDRHRRAASQSSRVTQAARQVERGPKIFTSFCGMLHLVSPGFQGSPQHPQ